VIITTSAVTADPNDTYQPYRMRLAFAPSGQYAGSSATLDLIAYYSEYSDTHELHGPYWQLECNAPACERPAVFRGSRDELAELAMWWLARFAPGPYEVPEELEDLADDESADGWGWYIRASLADLVGVPAEDQWLDRREAGRDEECDWLAASVNDMAGWLRGAYDSAGMSRAYEVRS